MHILSFTEHYDELAIEPFVNVRVMRNLLQKLLPDRLYIDNHTINNIRIHVCPKK